MKNFLLFFFFGIVVLLSCKENPPLTLDKGKLLNEVHENSVGKLAFMKEWIPFEDFTEEDFQKELFLTNGSNFGFRMFLEHTLTFYLSELEPNLSVEELCEKGNFQLTFFVDNKEIYKKNLQTGAGSCDYKNSATVYGVPLVHEKEPDHWGRFLWMRFMREQGGQKALSEGTHTLKLEIRPYIENEKLKVGEVIAKGEVQLSYLEEELKEEQISIQAIAPTDAWKISKKTFDTTLIRKLNRKVAAEYFKDITSIVVIKDGELMIEEYFNGANRSTLHDTRSVGKSLASTLMGMAIDEGYIKNEQQTLNAFYNLGLYKNPSASKENVTLKSLLTMSSGFDGSDMNPNSPGNEENMYPTSDWVKFALDLSMDSTKKLGQDWDYFTAGVVVLGDILNNTVPNGLEDYADEKLFRPLGISNYRWQFTPTNVPNTAGGFQMNSLDNAKYGQLYLNNGQYDCKEILSKEWVQKSLSRQVSIPNRSNEYYGYLLWNKTYTVGANEYEAYYASGNGGNKIMIFDDLNAVIVITATAYGQPYMHIQADEMVKEYLLPAIVQ